MIRIGQRISIPFRPSASTTSTLCPDPMADTWSPQSTTSYVANITSWSTIYHTPSSTTNNLSDASRHHPNPPTILPVVQHWYPGYTTTRIPAFHSSNSSSPTILWWPPSHIDSPCPSHHPMATVWDITSDELHNNPPSRSSPYSCSIPSALLWQRTTSCRAACNTSTDHIYSLLSCTTARLALQVFRFLYVVAWNIPVMFVMSASAWTAGAIC